MSFHLMNTTRSLAALLAIYLTTRTLDVGMIGNGALQAMGRQPEAIAKLQTAMIIIGAFAEALTIYAFVTVFLLMGKI